MTILADYPAYEIFSAKEASGLTRVRHGEKVFVKMTTRRGEIWKGFHVASAAGYAMEYDECPVEAFNRAKTRGEQTHSFVGAASMISSHKAAKARHKGLEIGDRVLFEGRYFELKLASNQNVFLREISKEEAA